MNTISSFTRATTAITNDLAIITGGVCGNFYKQRIRPAFC